MNTKLYVLDLGSMRMDKNLVASMSLIATEDAPQKANELAEFPVPAYLIESDYGYVLYDTGCHPECMGVDGRWPLQFQKQCPFKGTEETTVLFRLKELGIEPKEIKTIILSHMHNDHAGCIEFFKGSNFIVHQDEFNAAIKAYATHDYMSSYIWRDMDNWIRTKLKWNFIENGEGDTELFKGLTILNLGAGHARGVLGLKLDLKNTGTVILTSDAIYCRDNFENMREPGVVFDTVGWRKSAKRIKKLACENNAKVWFGHDRSQFDTLMKSSEGFYD